MNTAELIEKTRRILNSGEQKGSGPWSDLDLLRNLNDAMAWIHSRQLSINPYAYAEWATLAELGAVPEDLRLGRWRVTLPYYVVLPLAVEKNQGQFVTFTSSLRDPKAPRGGRDLDTLHKSEGLSVLRGRGNDLIFRGQDRIDVNTYTVCYAHRPVPLARFKVVEDGTTTTLGFEARAPKSVPTGPVESTERLGDLYWRDHAYQGAMIEITRSGGSSPESEIRRVSSSSLGSYPIVQLTVAQAFSSPPRSGDTVDMIPEMDPLYHELPCYLAAVRSLESTGMTAQKESISSTAAERYKEWIAIANTRQRFEGSHLIPESRT